MIELQIFEDMPEPAGLLLKGHRATWRLSHDIGLLGGTAPLPARPEDIENAGAFASWSAKLGAHVALARILDGLSGARPDLEARLGPALLSCLLFDAGRERSSRGEAIRRLIGQAGDIDWSEALAGARRAFRTIRHGLLDRPAQRAAS